MIAVFTKSQLTCNLNGIYCFHLFVYFIADIGTRYFVASYADAGVR
jgi:hypothetical protein